jgi:hypothetical protein
VLNKIDVGALLRSCSGTTNREMAFWMTIWRCLPCINCARIYASNQPPFCRVWRRWWTSRDASVSRHVLSNCLIFNNSWSSTFRRSSAVWRQISTPMSNLGGWWRSSCRTTPPSDWSTTSRRNCSRRRRIGSRRWPV